MGIKSGSPLNGVCKGGGVTLGRGVMSRRTRKTVSGDDTHNEEYCGCVILIIPLTLSQSLMLFDSSQQPCWTCVCVRACASECICMQEFCQS